MTIQSALNELLDNSMDAAASNIYFKEYKNTNEICIIDDGIGMNEEGLEHCMDICRENHSNHMSSGIAGKGFHISSLELSKDSTKKPRYVKVITKQKESSNYLTAFINYEDVFRIGKIDNMATIMISNNTDIQEFKKQRPQQNYNYYGTSIYYPFNEEIMSYINKCFDINNKCKFLKIKDRIDIEFGKRMIETNCSIGLFKQDQGLTYLNPYWYFKDDIQTYINKTEVSIYVYIDENKNYQFILKDNNNYKYFKTHINGRSSKTIEIVDSKKLHKWGQYIGIFILSTSCHYNKNMFDIENPIIINNISHDLKLSSYDSQFFNESNKFEYIQEMFSKIMLLRNFKVINYIPLENYKLSSIYENGLNMLKICNIRQELQYNIESKQGNDMDRICNIQSNKNQHIKKLPNALIRLIEYEREKYFINIKKYFENVYNQLNPVKPIEEPIKLIEEPVKPIEEPVNTIEESFKLVEEPVNPIEESFKLIEESVKSIEEPIHEVLKNNNLVIQESNILQKQNLILNKLNNIHLLIKKISDKDKLNMILDTIEIDEELISGFI
jgi:hypothetical protein